MLAFAVEGLEDRFICIHRICIYVYTVYLELQAEILVEEWSM